MALEAAPARASQPPSRRLGRRDKLVLLLWVLAGLAGAAAAWRYFFDAFPEAAVEFRLTRAAALAEARAFVAGRGADLQGYDSTIVFGLDEQAKTYLERELDLAEANRLMASAVTVWYWQVRFFRPLVREEFEVRVHPAGGIVGYVHTVAEAAPGARLGRAEALERAEQFLRDTLARPLGDYDFLPDEANSLDRPNRRDWSFTWERRSFRAADAPYRMRVTVQGNRIGGYEEFLRVPEQWQRDYARLRSGNSFIQTLALIPYAMLLGAALTVLLALARQGALRWGGGLRFGLFIAALYFLMQMNLWPVTRAGYDTNTSYSGFVASQLGAALGLSLLLALLAVVALLPGEPLYRSTLPDRLRLGAAFGLPAWRSKEFFTAGVVGVSLAAAHIGFVVLFYVVGRRFGIWAPQDLQYSDTLSTVLPWTYPLTIGIYASVSEEFLFRLFAIPFLLRLTRSKVLAVVLPALAWGFLHSNYPQQPAYIRGVEVGLIGIVAGVVMLRWGILATLTWHYAVDAFLIGLSLMRSADLYSRLSGSLVAFAPVIAVGVAGLLYLARGAFADSESLLNRAEPLRRPPAEPVAAAVPRPVPSYVPLTKRALALVALGGVAGLALFVGVREEKIGDFVRFSLDAAQARARAAEVLREQGVDPGSYRTNATTVFTFDPLVNEYLRRAIGVSGANRVYRDQVPSAFWAVRFFRDSEREEYRVILRPDGALHSVHHTLEEAAPGPSLTKEEALERASAFLRDAKGLDLAQWRLVEEQSDRLPARTDHRFAWERLDALTPPAGEYGAAHVRVSLAVQGAEVSGYRVFIHVPEEWLRRQNETTLARSAQSIGFSGLLIAAVVAVLVAFFRNLRHSGAAVPWRRLAFWSLAVLIASAASFLTMAPQYLAAYTTDWPFPLFVGTVVIVLALGAALFFSAVFFLLGLAWFFLARAFGAASLPRWRGMPRAYYRDALLLGPAGAAVLLGLARLPDWLARLWPVDRRSLPAAVPMMVDATFPALASLASAVTNSFIAIGVLALAIGFASCYLRRPWRQATLLVVVATLAVRQWGGAGEYLQNTAVALAFLVLLWWAAHRVVRFNLLAYFLMAMLLALVPDAVVLLRQPNPFFQANGWAVAAAAAALVLWPLAEWRWLGRAESPPESAGTA